ncbi:Protein phosphatase 2C-like protein [Quillaja saponaria]|uniref:protein-serine/threonine phosphatase n=1 Tax=Quillaja saponaria TaxID=32244 RepID=A0AAD7LUJ9_QUISA|nr:Protein phosphatase 2C-like protein [Quillaja saponaria]
MAGICCGVIGDTETLASTEPSSRPSRRRRLDLLPKFMADVVGPQPVIGTRKRKKNLDLHNNSKSLRQRENAVDNCESSGVNPKQVPKKDEISISSQSASQCLNSMAGEVEFKNESVQDFPKFGVTSVCGGRRDMEDAVSVQNIGNAFHFFGVFDGHGCSHVASMCKNKMHNIVKEEVEAGGEGFEWKNAMEKSFARMDEEVSKWSNGEQNWSCRCELQTPNCDAVGSTAVVAVVTPDKIVVSNCGDSRAVLCRNGVAIPLSSDHKPDRPDELHRIESAGGRVIYWDGPRVLGVLAMSRAIGDNYLKPYVIPEPDVTVTDRTAEDECLILASDGLWDVVSNDTACGVVRTCLRGKKTMSQTVSPGSDAVVGSAAESSDKACSDASILLTKLALARHSTDNVSVVVVDLKRNQHQN